jgi:putative FmdB family regulatory protein
VPLYEYKCKKCGWQFELYKAISERDNVECCGQKAKRLISKSQGKPVIKGYFSENLNAHITGPKQRERIMKEKGVTCAG